MKFALLATAVLATFSDIWTSPQDPRDAAWNENQKGGGLAKFPGLKLRLA